MHLVYSVTSCLFYVYKGVHVEVRGQLCGVGSLLHPQVGSGYQTAGFQAWVANSCLLSHRWPPLALFFICCGFIMSQGPCTLHLTLPFPGALSGWSVFAWVLRTYVSISIFFTNHFPQSHLFIRQCCWFRPCDSHQVSAFLSTHESLPLSSLLAVEPPRAGTAVSELPKELFPGMFLGLPILKVRISMGGGGPRGRSRGCSARGSTENWRKDCPRGSTLASRGRFMLERC